MRPIDERLEGERLLAEGLSRRVVAERLGVPSGTVGYWRLHPLDRTALGCPVCDGEGLADEIHGSYAYLLGAYLGDGHIAHFPRGVFRLSIYCTADYPEILLSVRDAMRAVMPRNRVGMSLQGRDAGCISVTSYSKHWPCLFPQHGPGMKHQREIKLVEWQREIVDLHPRALLRGLIHSDGSRFTNRVQVNGKTYEYPRYTFTNVSDDIRRIFCDACDAIGVQWRRMNAKNISIARRASVAKLDEFIGPKA